MKISGLTRILTAVATTTALTVAAAPAHAQQSKAGDPLFGAPTVGTCSTMTATQAAAAADHSTAVDCTATHTAQVAGVVQLPVGMKWSTASVNDLFRVVVARCDPKANAVLGRNVATRDSSAYDSIWFEPTKAQRSHGARWLSCSVILRHAKALAPLPTSTTPFLPDGTLPDDVARCITKRGFRTPCTATHAWRTTGTFSVAGKFPGAKVLNRKANRKCASRVTTADYGWLFQSKVKWNVGGDHVVVCFSKTTA